LAASPFFLWVSYLAPHFEAGQQRRTQPAPRHRGALATEPLPKPPNFNERDYSDKPAFLQRAKLTSKQVTALTKEHRLRLESLLAIDEGVEDIVDKLEATGKLGQTYIFYLSDNGLFQGHHRIIGGKESYYEPSIRVPLIVRGPDVPKNVTRAQLVSNVDLAPTIVELTGVKPELTMDGRSLLPAIKGADSSWRTGVYLTGRIREPKVSSDKDAYFDGIRTPRYTYVEHKNGQKEFYDLKVDPYELDNKTAAGSYAEVRADLAAKLKILKECKGATCWVTAADLTPK
jgi:N-acetylglucosamine-6-sulfatase